jgi:caffeoyl-CoA O-methyltransferase
MHLVSASIEQYAHDHTKPRGDVLEEIRAYTQANVPMSQMIVGPVEGALLETLAALCLARALPPEGRVITCDKSEAYTAVARRFWAKSEHGVKIDLRMGDALETVRALPAGEVFDMAFIDADKTRYVDYYEEIVPRVRAGGIVCLDNVLWSGAVLAPETDEARALAAINDRIQVDPRVDNLLLPVRDGIMIARKL